MIYKTHISLVLVILATSAFPFGSAKAKSIREMLHPVAEKLPTTKISEIATTDIIPMLLPLKKDPRLHLHVLYDHQNEEAVESLVLHFSGELSGMMIYQYDGTSRQVEEILTSSEGTALLLALCTPINVLHIFNMVNKRRLRSHLVHWVLTLDKANLKDNVIDQLETLIFEGTQVTLVIRESFGGGLSVFSAYVTDKGLLRFSIVGRWSRGDMVGNGFPPLLTSGQLQQHTYDDMRGRMMIVSALEYWPFFLFAKTDPDGSVKQALGVDASILETLSHLLNFTYKIVPPEDQEWGNPQPNGKVSGIVGDVARREAHFSLCQVAITEARSRVVDFSVPYFEDGLRLFSRAPLQRSRVFALVSPFSIQVWVSISISVLVMGPVLFVVSILMRKEQKRHSLRDLEVYSFNVFRSVVIQGNLLQMNLWPQRFTVFFWYLFCLNVSALYSGMLTAALAIPSYETPVDYLTDLTKAVQEDGFTLGVYGGTFVQYLFQDAKDGIYKEVWGLFNHDDPSESFVKDDITGIKRILERKYIYIGAETESMLLATGLGRRKFHFSQETFRTVRVGMPCPPGAPYQNSFNHWLMRMVEAGLITKWLEYETSSIPQNLAVANGQSKTSPFSLSHLQAAFLVIAFGYFLAVLVLLVEVIPQSKIIFL